MAKPTITFYLPRETWPSPELPTSIESDASMYFLPPHLTWVLQTYLRLKAAGYPVLLSSDFPEEGIIVTFSNLLPPELVPGPRQYLVSISADSSSHFYAQLHVVQNRIQTQFIANSIHIPHWPQPGIVPRDLTRGLRFERAAFFGDTYNLAEDLRSPEWGRSLSRLGLDWSIRDQSSTQKTDYSDVDVVIAARSFQRRGYIRKPASKLYNAWIAGVPAVLGVEFAFREERRTGFDFIEVNTYQAAIKAMRELKESEELRRNMIENGFRRAKDFSIEKLTERWWRMLAEVASPKLDDWTRLTDSQRKSYVLKRKIDKKIRGTRHRALNFLGYGHNSP